MSETVLPLLDRLSEIMAFPFCKEIPFCKETSDMLRERFTQGLFRLICYSIVTMCY